MGYITDILDEEYQRLRALSLKYESEITSLPRGSISIKKRGRNKYLYLAYREKGKIRFDYIGPEDSVNARMVIEKIERRKEYEDKLKQVKQNLAEIERAVHGRKR